MLPPDLSPPIAAEEIYRVAAALPEVERAAYLDSTCDGQPAARARIERMLEVQGIAAALLQPADETIPEDSEEGGERIGHYQLIEPIGEGGFGVVWLAEQVEPVQRRVALKIIKIGMDTREVIARFEQERQALALMDHPGIAKVFDAGATPTGRPYFVMELVQGVPITDYCDRERLPTADRLQLFIAVCQAVQHAHQKGIIHRDLKPSNILVAVQDGVAVPKVIDFGVAKATQPLGGLGALSLSKRQERLGALTIQTGLAQMLGTPLYMAPEQAELGALDIDTRADIYALGVLLYELLTGRTPFDPEELMRAGLDEMRRAIREQEPPKPSTVLHTMAIDARTTVAQRRKVDGEKLIGQIRGDLDWIVMKALEKDRTRRYATASDFALDLRRHLASEPVAARAPSVGYQAGKFVRRNRRVVAAAGAVFLALLAGLIASTVLYLREKTAWTSEAAQRQKAETSAQRAETEAGKARAQTVIAERNAEAEAAARREAEAIANFLTEVFQSPDPARDGRTITVAETLDRAARKLDTDLADQPKRRASFQDALGRTYRALGLPREAIIQEEKAREYFVETLGPEHPDTHVVMHNLAISYSAAGRRDEALQLREQALELLRKVNGPEHPHTLVAMHSLANSYSDVGRRDEALHLREQVLELRRKLLSPEHPETLAATGSLANSYAEAGRQTDALKLREESLPLFRKTLGPKHPDTLSAMHNLANSYSDAGRRDEALQLREQVLELSRKLLSPEHPETLTATGNLATSYAEAGRVADALKLREESLSLFRKTLGPEHPDTLRAMQSLANSYSDAGRQAEALELREQVLELSRKVLSPEHPETLTATGNLANSYAEAGRQTDALKLREESLSLFRKTLGPEHPETLKAMNNLGESYAAVGRQADALQLREQVLELRRKTLGPEHAETLSAMAGLARSYADAYRWDEAVKLQEETLALCRQTLALDHPETLSAMNNLAISYVNANRRDEALKLREQVLELRLKTLGPEHPNTLGAMTNLAISYGLAGAITKAIELQEKSLAIKRRVLHPGHPFLAVAIDNLATCYEAAGRTQEAKTLRNELAALKTKARAAAAPK